MQCMWECQQTQLFLPEVKTVLEKILSKRLTLSPALFLLSLYPVKHKFGESDCTFIDIGLVTAKRCVAQAWIYIHRHTVNQWLKQMLGSLPLETITYILKTKQHLFENIWGTFMDYMKNLELTEDPADS